MIPLIIVSSDKKNLDDYIDGYIAKNSVEKSHAFEIYPETKEFSINQIREIKKRAIFNTTRVNLYILYDFDKASFEAQNAFLKTLEEHNPLIQYILSVERYGHLLPTIISRSKVIILDKRQFTVDEKIENLLERFIKTGDLEILNSLTVKKSTTSDPLEYFDQFLLFFRKRLLTDKNAPNLLQEILNTKALVEFNNVSPQLAIDHLALLIRRRYASVPTMPA